MKKAPSWGLFIFMKIWKASPLVGNIYMGWDILKFILNIIKRSGHGC